MASLFSVSRLIGKSRTRSTKRTSSVQYASQEDQSDQSRKRIQVDSAPSMVTAGTSSKDEPSEANSRPGTIPKEQDFSFPPTPYRESEVTKTHESKAETLEEPGYDIVLQPSAKVSFGEWTELDTGKKASEPAAKDMEWTQLGIDKKEQSLAKTFLGAPFDIGEHTEEYPPKPSIPDWTHLEIDNKADQPSVKPSVEWLQFDKQMEKDVAVLSDEHNGGNMPDTHINEERTTHVEEMRIVREEKEKLAERVKELEEKLHQAEHELQVKMEQIDKLFIDVEQNAEEIEALKEEKGRIQRLATREKEESLKDIRRSNEAIAARWQAAKDLKEAETKELMAKQDDMQEEIDMMIGHLSASRARVVELETANELQAKKLLGKDVAMASHSDVIAVLKRQKANLTAQIHTLRTNAKINERQNSMLMVQLRQQSDDIVAWKGIRPSLTQSVRRPTGPTRTLVEQAVRTIKALNEEIFQTAASLTDCVDDIEKRFVDEPDDTAAALETLKSLLGTEIYKELYDEGCMMKDDYKPFVLQTGFQVCLTACCMRTITSWYPAEPEYGKFLEVVYEKIRGLGRAEDAAQWRKWTLQSCCVSDNTGTKGILSNFITDNLYAMLSMSGWPKLGETANLLDSFNDKISEIVNLAIRLKTLVAETTTPGDLMATTIEEGKDYVPHDMTDDSPEGEWDNTHCEAPYSQVVVGCVGLGLKWREGDMYEAQLLLKPRVILRKKYKLHSWA